VALFPARPPAAALLPARSFVPKPVVPPPVGTDDRRDDVAGGADVDAAAEDAVAIAVPLDGGCGLGGGA
jgi:hypothetical protein